MIENHNLPASMLGAMDRHYPVVAALRPDFAAYYYYPRNVAAPDKTMNIIRTHLSRHRRVTLSSGVHAAPRHRWTPIPVLRDEFIR